MPCHRTVHCAGIDIGKSKPWHTRDCHPVRMEGPDQRSRITEDSLDMDRSIEGTLTLFAARVDTSPLERRRWLCVSQQERRLQSMGRVPFAYTGPSRTGVRRLCYYQSVGAIESEPITGVLPGPRFGVMNFSSASLKPG